MARQNHVRKLTPKATAHILCAGPFKLDLEQHQAELDGQMISLPACTYEYLVTLLRNSPHPVSYQDLVLESQGNHLGRLEAQDLARCRIYILRKAVEPDPQFPHYILAVAGYGYRLAL